MEVVVTTHKMALWIQMKQTGEEEEKEGQEQNIWQLE